MFARNFQNLVDTLYFKRNVSNWVKSVLLAFSRNLNLSSVKKNLKFLFYKLFFNFFKKIMNILIRLTLEFYLSCCEIFFLRIFFMHCLSYFFVIYNSCILRRNFWFDWKYFYLVSNWFLVYYLVLNKTYRRIIDN